MSGGVTEANGNHHKANVGEWKCESDCDITACGARQSNKMCSSQSPVTAAGLSNRPIPALTSGALVPLVGQNSGS